MADVHQLVQDGMDGKPVHLREFADAVRKERPSATSGMDDRAVFKYIARIPGNEQAHFENWNVLLDETSPQQSIQPPMAQPVGTEKGAPAQPAVTAPPPGGLMTGPVGRWGERVMTDLMTGAARVVGGPTGREKAAGVHQMVGATGEAMIPGMVAGAAVSPLAAARGLGLGTVAQAGTEKLLERAGVPPEYAQVGGDVAGILLGGRAARGRAPRTAVPATEPPPGAAPASVPAAELGDFALWRDAYFKRGPHGWEDAHGNVYGDQLLRTMHADTGGGQPTAASGNLIPQIAQAAAPTAAAAPAAPKIRNQDIADILRREAAANPKRQVNAEDIAVILKEGHGKSITPQARTKANRVLGELVDDGVLTSDRRILPTTATPPGAAAAPTVAPSAGAAAATKPAPVKPAATPTAPPPSPAQQFTPQEIAEAQELFPEPIPSAGRTPEVPPQPIPQAAPPAETPAVSPPEPATAPAETQPPPALPAAAAPAPSVDLTEADRDAALNGIADWIKQFGKEEEGTQYFDWRRPGAAGNIPPEAVFGHLRTLGRYYYQQLGNNFAAWQDSMLKALGSAGERLLPHLRSVWDSTRAAGGVEPQGPTEPPPEQTAAAAPSYLRWENLRRTDVPPPAGTPGFRPAAYIGPETSALPGETDVGQILSRSAGAYGQALTPEEAAARTGPQFTPGGTSGLFESTRADVAQATAPPIPEPPTIVGRGKNAKVVPAQPRTTVTPKGSPDVTVKPKLKSGMTPEQIAAERTAALTARPPGLPEIELGQRMARAIRSQENLTEAEKAAQFEQERILRRRGTQQPPGAPAPELPREIPQRPYSGPTQAKDVATQALADAGFKGRTIMNRNAVMQVRDPEIKARLMRDAMTPTARPHAGGFRGKSSPRGPARPGVMAESEMMTPNELVDYLRKDQLPTSRVFSKPVSDGVLQVQWNDEFQAWNATKIYTDTGQVNTISGIGPESLTNYLNRAQQLESPIPSSQQTSRSFAGGTQVTSAPIIGTPTEPPPGAQPSAAAAEQLAATSARFDDPALYNEYLRRLARSAMPATPETIAEYERLRAAEQERLRRTIVPPSAPGEGRSLGEQLRDMQAAEREAPPYRGEPEESEAANRPVRGELHTPGSIRPPDLRERNLVAAQEVSDDAARRIIAEHSKRMATEESGLTPEERARAEAARGKPGARAKAPQESPFEVRPSKADYAGDEVNVGDSWRIWGKDGAETNVHIAKQGKMYRVYVGNRGGVGYSNLISAKNEAMKVAERAAYRVVQRNAPFRVPGAGEYMMMGETPEGNISYQFTPEGGAPVRPPKGMPPAMWEHLQQQGESIKSPVEPEPAKRGRPAKTKEPEVTFAPPSSTAPTSPQPVSTEPTPVSTPTPINPAGGPPSGMASQYAPMGQFWARFTFDPATGAYVNQQGGRATPMQVQELARAGRIAPTSAPPPR